MLSFVFVIQASVIEEANLRLPCYLYILGKTSFSPTQINKSLLYKANDYKYKYRNFILLES